jgi:transposase
MKKNDGRKLSKKTKEEIRIRAVQQVQAGESPEVVIKALGYTRTVIYRWLEKFAYGGYDALKATNAPGKQPKLNARQLNKLFKVIVDKTPDQLKFPFALWTRDLVREYIRDKFGVSLSGVSVSRLLAKMGLSPQKPLMRAYQQDENLVKTWMTKDFPAIKALAKREKASIFFGDEAGVRSDNHIGTTWAPIGKTPIVKTTGARFGVNIISAISPRGEMEFMITKGKFNSEVFINFMKKLIRYKREKVFLIVDGHPTHKSKMVAEFVEKNKDRLRLYILPPYSPELNPDELVWNTLKQNIGRKKVNGPDDLQQKVVDFLESMAANISLVASFFHEKFVLYII